MHQTEHQKLDVEIAAIEAELAKNVDQEEGSKREEGASNDQSISGKDADHDISIKEGERVVTTTIIGKPDWGEADTVSVATSERAESKEQNLEESDSSKRTETVEEK